MLRGFDHYLDGYFIADPHGYSHGGIYIGKGKVVHAVAEGVSLIDALDFMKCDRICVLRPISGKKAAVAKAKRFAKDNVPYDFCFTRDASALYCFELCAECYPNLDVKPLDFNRMFGLLRRSAYLADSFRDSRDFKVVLEFNLRHGIDR